MTVHTPYAPTTTTPAGKGQQQPGQRRPLVIGLVVTFGVLAAVVVAGRVVTTRTTAAPVTTPAAATGELNAKALADRYSTAGMASSIRDDTGAWLHRQSIAAPSGVQSGYGNLAAVQRHFTTTSHELNAKAIADRYSTVGMVPSIRDDTGAWLHRRSISTPTGVQSGYGNPAAVQRHFTGTHELNAKALADRYSTTVTSPAPPGVQLRRSPRIVDPEPSPQVPPQLVP